MCVQSSTALKQNPIHKTYRNIHSRIDAIKLTRFSNSALSSINGWKTPVNIIQYAKVSPTTPALRSTAASEKRVYNALIILFFNKIQQSIRTCHVEK